MPYWEPAGFIPFLWLADRLLLMGRKSQWACFDQRPEDNDLQYTVYQVVPAQFAGKTCDASMTHFQGQFWAWMYVI